MNGIVYVPGGDEGYVALSSNAAKTTGKLFRKHILSKGTLHYPGLTGGSVEVDDTFLAAVAANFKAGTAGIVQFPVADGNNDHTEDPLRNIGEIVDVKVENGKLYSYIDVRDDSAAPKVGKTILGASAMLSLNYTDTRTGKKAGPTLLHVAATNRPHVVDLEDFEEFAALSSVDSSKAAVFLTAQTKKDKVMELDEIISTLKDDHGIDLPTLQRTAADASNIASLSASLTDALSETGVLKLSAGSDATSDDLVAAVTQLATDRVELSAKVDTLMDESKTAAATARVDSLIAEAKIQPKDKDAQIELLLSNKELFEKLLPEKPFVQLSAESGFQTADETPSDVIDGEIARLSAYAASEGLVKA